jgi:hypothetical protein
VLLQGSNGVEALAIVGLSAIDLYTVSFYRDCVTLSQSRMLATDEEFAPSVV